MLDPAARSKLFVLPDFALALIAASWLGSSLFAPQLAGVSACAGRTTTPRRRPRVLSLGLGALLGANLFLRRYVADFDMSPAEAATLVFPLFLIGGLLLWRFSRIMRTVRRHILARDRGVAVGDRTGAINLGVLR